MGTGIRARTTPMLWYLGIRRSVRNIVDKTWVRLRGDHLVVPDMLGTGDHDCAPLSLYWAAPWIPECRIYDAFLACAENWPYGGVTNKEFQIALKYLEIECFYSAKSESLGKLLARKPSRCVCLLHGHFIAVIRGKIVGRDTYRAWSPSTEVYCHWIVR